jgi:hypothetical protein
MLIKWNTCLNWLRYSKAEPFATNVFFIRGFHRTIWFSGNVPDLNSGCARFEARPRHRLSWLRFFMVSVGFLSPSLQILGKHLDIPLPRLFKFSPVHQTSSQPTLYVLLNNSIVKYSTKNQCFSICQCTVAYHIRYSKKSVAFNVNFMET